MLSAIAVHTIDAISAIVDSSDIIDSYRPYLLGDIINSIDSIDSFGYYSNYRRWQQELLTIAIYAINAIDNYRP